MATAQKIRDLIAQATFGTGGSSRPEGRCQANPLKGRRRWGHIRLHTCTRRNQFPYLCTPRADHRSQAARLFLKATLPGLDSLARAREIRSRR